MNVKRTLGMLVLAAGCAFAQQPGMPSGAPPAGGASESAPAAEKTMGRQPLDAGKGKRDPFQNIVAHRGKGGTAALCTGSGKACMAPGQAELKGVAKTQEGYIAMVVSAEKKTYFLRLNEPVLNGYVLKITGDSITFRENVVDNVGRTSSRDVVKRITGSGI